MEAVNAIKLDLKCAFHTVLLHLQFKLLPHLILSGYVIILP